MFTFLLAIQVGDGWRPGIGDPTLVGWLTVVAYLGAAIACAAAAQAERKFGDITRRTVHPVFWTPDSHRERESMPNPGTGRRGIFWWLLAAALTVLAINKQLDLQSLVTVIGRRVAEEQGWYEDRQQVQRAFIIGVAAVGLASLIIVTFIFRSAVRRSPLAAIGLTFLFVFVLVRASSFHNVDVFLSGEILGLRKNWLLELGGIACVFVSAVHRVAGSGKDRGD